ncbi:MAG: hypothetical protein CMJ28_00095, partial [Phycisphaerae bacterium]|nr:hypothetical protein [Phycisphaerae bacterium]
LMPTSNPDPWTTPVGASPGFGGGNRFVYRPCYGAFGDGYASGGENIAGLMLMNLHLVLLKRSKDSTERRGLRFEL